MVRLKEKLEVVTNCLVLAVCVIWLYTFVSGRLKAPHPIRPGSTITALKGLDWSAQPRTLILAVRAGCHYCEDSVPFYQRLLDLDQRDRLDLRIVAAVSDPHPVAEQFLRSHRLSLEMFDVPSLPDIGVTATPTLILADNRGRVIKSWVGRLNDLGEADVVKAISSRTTDQAPKKPTS